VTTTTERTTTTPVMVPAPAVQSTTVTTQHTQP
jgi:hypothetical protein